MSTSTKEDQDATDMYQLQVRKIFKKRIFRTDKFFKSNLFLYSLKRVTSW